MEPAILFVAILMICELFEAWWQRADTIEGLLANGYRYYRQSIFIFFLMHPSFYFVLYVILATGIFNGWMMAVLVLKVADLFLKITMMQKLFVHKEADDAIGPFLQEPMSPWLLLTGVSLYPILLMYALA
jgi:hypothetical protein